MLRAMSPTEITQEESHVGLLAGFVELLLDQSPRTVLDVGCGSGGLLRACAERGLVVAGVDRPGDRFDRLEALAGEGFAVHAGSAYDLPFADGAFDWVTLRHVPHHLERPAEAIAEALRVAGTGLLVGEPCFDERVPGQAAAHALDVWEKRQHRRGGMYHDEVHTEAALRAMLRDGLGPVQVDAVTIPPVGMRSVPSFLESARALLARLPEDATEAAALDALVEQLERDGLAWNGTVCVLVRKP